MRKKWPRNFASNERKVVEVTFDTYPEGVQSQ